MDVSATRELANCRRHCARGGQPEDSTDRRPVRDQDEGQRVRQRRGAQIFSCALTSAVLRHVSQIHLSVRVGCVALRLPADNGCDMPLQTNRIIVNSTGWLKDTIEPFDRPTTHCTKHLVVSPCRPRPIACTACRCLFSTRCCETRFPTRSTS